MNRQKIRYLCFALLGLMGHMRGHMIGHTLMAQTASFTVQVDLNALPVGARVASGTVEAITELSKVADTLDIKIMTADGTMWTVSASASWLRPLDADEMPITGGTGAATVRMAYPENSTGGERMAMLTFAPTEAPIASRRKVFMLTQRGVVNPLRVSIRNERSHTSSTTLLNSPTQITIDNRGGSRRGVFDVDVVATGNWEVCINDAEAGFDNWVTIGTEPIGDCFETSGTKRIGVRIDATVTTNTRMTMLKFKPDMAGPNPVAAPPFPATVTITQPGTDPVFTISVTSRSVSARAGSFRLSLSATVPVTISTDQPSWIEVVDTSDGDDPFTGIQPYYYGRNEVVTIRYALNTTPVERVAMVTFSTTSTLVSTRRRTVRITQAAGEPGGPGGPGEGPQGTPAEVIRGLQVYPNPVARAVSIAVDEQAQMGLRSTEGTLLHTYPLLPGQNHIDLRAYTARGGVYFVEIETVRGRVVRRLAIK